MAGLIELSRSDLGQVLQTVVACRQPVLFGTGHWCKYHEGVS